MKWEKAGQKERRKTATWSASADESAQWSANCPVSPEPKQVQVRTDPPTPTPSPPPNPTPPATSLPAHPGLTAPLHRWMPSDDAVSRVMGSVFSSRALQQLLQRDSGTLHGWLVHIRNTALALLFFFFLSAVRSKARHYIKTVMRPKYIQCCSMCMHFRMRWICRLWMKDNRITTHRRGLEMCRKTTNWIHPMFSDKPVQQYVCSLSTNDKHWPKLTYCRN